MKKDENLKTVLIDTKTNFSSGQNVDWAEQKGGSYKYGSDENLVISGGKLWVK